MNAPLPIKTILEKFLLKLIDPILGYDGVRKRLLHKIISSENHFSDLIDMLIDDPGDSFSNSIKKIVESDKTFNKIESFIHESDVGKSNQNDREIWLENALKNIVPGGRILDAGAGELQYKKYCNHLNYVSQDFAKYDGVGDRSALQIGKWDQSRLDIISDITSIPEPDASFDAIMCIEVFEHLPNPFLAIKEFSRLLRLGGELIITAPFCSLTHFAPYHFFTGFNHFFYEKYLVEYGFNIIEIIPNGNYFEYIAQEIRRTSEMAERYASDNPTRDELLCMKYILRMLARFSSKDINSHELLNYGYHIRAKKVT